MDRVTYHKMMAAKQLVPNKKQGRHPMRSMYLNLLSFQVKFLNFNASMGTSDTNNRQKSSMKRKRNTALNFPETRNAYCPSTKELQNKAFAGVGNPMNSVVCRVSVLNLANRKAEKAAMRNAV